MNILVYNLAAEYAGALTILKNFYNEVKNYNDKNIHWYFIVSTNILENTDNITIIQFPEIKKSWFHRWAFDTFKASKLIKKYKIDKVLSMQNMKVKNCDVEQIVYLHQSLQFSPVRYSLFKREERSYAIRQKIICDMIKHSLKGADKIIVQTNWMKDATIKWVNSSKPKYFIVSPVIELGNDYFTDGSEFNNNIFFYPAGDGLHKNHDVIIDACILLKKENIINYKIVFTLDKTESEYSKRLYQRVCKNELNIEFVGLLSKEQVMDYYKHTTLLFPSYLETFGLPLLEASNIGGPIFASDLPFAHEILDEYENAYFFSFDSPEQLTELIRNKITNPKIINEKQSKQTSKMYKDLTIIDVILKN